MIAGGYGRDHSDVGSYSSVEVYSPETNSTCLLPDITFNRLYNKAHGTLICDDTYYDKCYNFSTTTGTWERTNHTLSDVTSFGSVSWKINDEIMFFGGFNSTVMKPDGTVEVSFNLLYDIEYVIIQKSTLLIQHF